MFYSQLFEKVLPPQTVVMASVFFLFATAAVDWDQGIHSSATSFEFEKHSKNSLGEFSLRYYFPIKTRRFFGDYFASLAGK